MDLQTLLLEADRALSDDEVKSLVFLCTDLLRRDLQSVSSAKELFSLLTDTDLLSMDNPDLLVELLDVIQRRPLIRTLNLDDLPPKTIISPYRQMLYDLSENITQKELEEIKFLLNDKLPRGKLKTMTTLEVFLELEHKDCLSSTNLDLLNRIINRVCPMLKRKIEPFVTRRENSPLTEETQFDKTVCCSASDIAKGVQVFSSGHERHASSEEFGSVEHFRPSFTYSIPSQNISLDVPRAQNVTVGKLSEKLGCLTTSQDKGLGVYPMRRGKMGVCLIINNKDFTRSSPKLNNREGTQFDEKSLVSVFKWLGFQVKVATDCTRERMLAVLRQVASMDHGPMDCLVCCVLSHGLEGCLYGVDGATVRLKEITNPFNGLLSATLKEKPKIFFIQACQGSLEQKPVTIEFDGAEAPSGCVEDSLCSDAMVPKDTIASDADFLIGMATVPEYASFRDRTQGTWYIQSLCQNLIQMVPSGEDLMSILTKVNDDVSKKTDVRGERKQMPQPAFSLRKKVVFPIPDQPPPRHSNQSEST